MGQYNRQSGTPGRNQFDITEEDLMEVREQQKRVLDIELRTGTQGKHFALVHNFPGLDAEMSEFELRRMAEQLIGAADKLSDKNK